MTIRVGAIRWDAWHSNVVGSAAYYMGGNLGPSKYQARAPWFAVQNSSWSMTINGNTQPIMDAEIAYAKAANVRFWAYNWYARNNSLMNAWALHQASTHKADVNWCILVDYATFHTDVTSNLSEIVGYFQQSNYEKYGTRPMLFILPGGATLAADLTALQAACAAAGVSNPYVTVMSTSAALAASYKTSMGADAISMYAYNPGTQLDSAYAALDTATQAVWPSLVSAGTKIVPPGMMGWDRRPRIERPVPWEVGTQRAYIGLRQYFATATPAELVTHVTALLAYMVANPTACESSKAILYAWNEHDEGGWLCPTWTVSGADHSRLDALAAVLP